MAPLWKIRNLSLCRKIFQHCHFPQNFTRFQKYYRKFNPTLLLWATLKWFGGFLTNVPRIFRVFFYIIKHIWLDYILNPSVRPVLQSLGQSVRQSSSPSVRNWNLQSFSEPPKGSGLIINFCVQKTPCVEFTKFINNSRIRFRIFSGFKKKHYHFCAGVNDKLNKFFLVKRSSRGKRQLLAGGLYPCYRRQSGDWHRYLYYLFCSKHILKKHNLD